MYIDCHVENLRKLGYRNLEAWLEDPKSCYCARGRIIIYEGKRYPPHDSYFCNPFKVGKDGDLNTVLRLYSEYAFKKYSYNELMAIKGRNLGCWCKVTNDGTYQCHTQILSNMIDNAENLLQQGLIKEYN